MTVEVGALPRLSRSITGHGRAPVRMIHLGLGNFFRAHAAWYTDRAPDADRWGIAAFTGRSAATALSLAEQEGLYTLLVRGAAGPEPEIVSSLSAVHPADDLSALREYFRRPEVVVVTLTVTEAGYRRDGTGGLDLAADDIRSDVAALAADPAHGVVTTTPGRLVAGLLARRAAGAGPIAVVPNDNVPENGAMVARVVAELAAAVDPTLGDWLAAQVSYVTTMVDRITPRTTDDDRAAVARILRVDDPQTVPTEPFTEWVLAGDFPGGRPDWEAQGARFVDDVRPFEQRKLWLLNGSHSLMAYSGPLLGYETVAEAIADPTVRGWVEQWWDAAARHLNLPPGEITAYRAQLLDRFANPNIRHLLAQIAADGSQKIPIRAVPVLLADLRTGIVDPGVTRLVAAWIVHLRGHGAPVVDARAVEVTGLVDGDLDESVARTLTWLGIESGEVRASVAAQVSELAGVSAHRRT